LALRLLALALKLPALLTSLTAISAQSSVAELTCFCHNLHFLLYKNCGCSCHTS